MDDDDYAADSDDCSVWSVCNFLCWNWTQCHKALLSSRVLLTPLVLLNFPVAMCCTWACLLLTAYHMQNHNTGVDNQNIWSSRQFTALVTIATDMQNIYNIAVSVIYEYLQFSKCTCTLQEAWKIFKCVSELQTVIFAIYEVRSEGVI
jgi:hypothetical protein